MLLYINAWFIAYVVVSPRGKKAANAALIILLNILVYFWVKEQVSCFDGKLSNAIKLNHFGALNPKQ